MKPLIASMIAAGSILIAAPALAGHGHYHAHRQHQQIYHHGHNHWIVPAIVGGAVVYAITRPPTVVVAPPPAPVAQDIMILDGIAYRRQIMIIDGQSREVWIRN